MTDLDRLRDDPEALARLVEEHRMLKETIEHSPILFCVYDPSHNLLAWNKTYENNHAEGFAHLRAQGADDRINYADLVRYESACNYPPDQVEKAIDERIHLNAEADGKPILRQYGHSGWVQVIKYALPSGATEGMALDVNALKKREAELEEARCAAENAERVKAGFLAKMSHEIRTPMNGMLGMAEALIDTELSNDQRLSLDTIMSSGESLLALINDILDFSKIEAGKMDLVLRPFSLLDEAESLGRLLLPRARSLGLDLILDIDPSLDLPLVGDSSRIRQVLTNLLGNALKFTPKGHVLLRIDGVPRDSLLVYDITITVEDTGIGVPRDLQDTIFKPFSQLNNPLAHNAAGTGLGLSITADLVKAMDGTLSLTSVPDRGSTFECRLRLPMAKRAIDRVPRSPVPRAPTGQRGNISLIDPCSMHSNATLRALRHIGFAPASWPSVDAWEQGSDPHEHRTPVLLSARALPHDPARCCAAIERFDNREGACVLLWNRATPPPDRPKGPVIVDLTSLSGLFQTLSAPTQQPAAPPPKPKDESREVTVMVAEDNRTNRMVIERMLKARVSKLVFAVNGREAVDQTIAQPPDLILMDMSMPVMNGIDATLAIRAHEKANKLPRCPIVALTANAMASDREACLAAGMDDFLTKPVRLDSLLKQINAIRVPSRVTA